MSIWLTPPVEVEPRIHLVRWRIFQRVNGKAHFVGYYPEGFEGRVSSAIESFDPITRRGVTQSGRVYQLVGWPGFDTEAMYVWELWSRAKGWENCADVTDDVLAGIQAVNWKPSDA